MLFVFICTLLTTGVDDLDFFRIFLVLLKVCVAATAAVA